MASVRLAVLYSSLGRYLLMFIGLLSAMIIARMLTPAEIGTFAIASSIVMIMAEFRILGANTYIIREAELTDDKIRSAYGLTILISWSLGLLVVFLARPLAGYFELSEISLIFLILSVSFIFAPYISIPDAILTREYRFREIAFVRATAAICQLLLTIYLIMKGLSYYALAIGHLAAVIIQVVLNLYFTRHVKIYRPIFKGLKPIAKLGIYTSISHVVRKAQHTAPDMIIGKMGTPTLVGLFSRGLGFIVFVSDTLLSGITPVALPYLADVKKRGENIRLAYTRASQLIAGVVWPVLAVASVASLPAIRLMFGDQWDEAAPVASIIAFWAIFRSGHVLASNALVAMGNESTMLLKEILVFSVFLIAILFSYPRFGLVGVGYAFVFSGVFDFLVSSYFMKVKAGLNIINYYIGLGSSILVATTCGLATMLISYFYPFDLASELLTLLRIVIVLPLVWGLSIFCVNHPLKIEILRLYKRI